MPAPHGKLFAAIVVAGASFGASSCYLSHEPGDAGTPRDAGRDAGRDAMVAVDAGVDAGTDLGADLGDCPPTTGPDGTRTCAGCTFTFCESRRDCACVAFCCFI